MDDILSRATFLSDSPKEPGHKNPYEHFYYFKSTINGKNIRINVGEQVKTKSDGRVVVKYVCYSVNDI